MPKSCTINFIFPCVVSDKWTFCSYFSDVQKIRIRYTTKHSSSVVFMEHLGCFISFCKKTNQIFCTQHFQNRACFAPLLFSLCFIMCGHNVCKMLAVGYFGGNGNVFHQNNLHLYGANLWYPSTHWTGGLVQLKQASFHTAKKCLQTPLDSDWKANWMKLFL